MSKETKRETKKETSLKKKQPLTKRKKDNKLLVALDVQLLCEKRNKLREGAGIAQLVVLGLAVHSVAGSILLWGHFPVEGIFPLGLTWVQTPFPPKLFRMRV